MTAASSALTALPASAPPAPSRRSAPGRQFAQELEIARRQGPADGETAAPRAASAEAGAPEDHARLARRPARPSPDGTEPERDEQTSVPGAVVPAPVVIHVEARAWGLPEPPALGATGPAAPVMPPPELSAAAAAAGAAPPAETLVQPNQPDLAVDGPPPPPAPGGELAFAARIEQQLGAVLKIPAEIPAPPALAPAVAAVPAPPATVPGSAAVPAPAAPPAALRPLAAARIQAPAQAKPETGDAAMASDEAAAPSEPAEPSAPQPVVSRPERNARHTEESSGSAASHREAAPEAQPAPVDRDLAPLPPPAAASGSERAHAPESRPAGPRPPAADTARPVESAAPEQPARASEPVRDLSLRLADTARERVEVRLMERNGELRVAVRTPDPEIARGLRGELTDLVGRLDAQGLRAETWRPAESAFANSREHGGAPQDSFSGGRQGHARDQGGGSGQQQQPQPPWVEEMERQLGHRPGRERREFSWAPQSTR